MRQSDINRSATGRRNDTSTGVLQFTSVICIAVSIDKYVSIRRPHNLLYQHIVCCRERNVTVSGGPDTGTADRRNRQHRAVYVGFDIDTSIDSRNIIRLKTAQAGDKDISASGGDLKAVIRHRELHRIRFRANIAIGAVNIDSAGSRKVSKRIDAVSHRQHTTTAEVEVDIEEPDTTRSQRYGRTFIIKGDCAG